MAMLRTAALVVLHLAVCLAVPLPCEQTVVHLEAEIQRLVWVIEQQHQYIQELHHSQATALQQIPSMHLGQGTFHRDCSDAFAAGNVASGLYVVRPDGSPTALSVYCDMSHGGGWTIFQRRTDGTENFDRAWVEYKHGFGDLHSPDGEFWLGNDALHQITREGTHELRIDMEDFEDKQRYAQYNNFKVDSEQEQYQLHLGEYSGDAGDAMQAGSPQAASQQKWSGPGSESARMKFSTYDHPNYEATTNCIRHDKSGWWFSRCESGNLNGHYYQGPYQAMTEDGVVWYTWHGWWYSVKSVVMMVRAADVEHRPPVLAQLAQQTQQQY